MSYVKHPISALQEWCQRQQIDLPKFEEGRSSGEPHRPCFSYKLFVNGRTYGPSQGKSKSEAKCNVAIMAADDIGLYHTGGKVTQGPAKAAVVPVRNAISKLFEYAQAKQWPKPKDYLLQEEGPAHEKFFKITYKIGEKEFPPGAGLNKDFAKRRAASRALSELKDVRVREYMRGPDPDIPFGDQIAAFAWEAFGILCEEMGESPDFCMSQNMACFILENIEDGTLRVVSLGTGHGVCNKEWRAINGETVIDSHPIVVARRNLLLFFYDQLNRLLECETSVFQYGSSAIAQLKPNYELHLYSRYPPCGSSRNETAKRKSTYSEVKNNHDEYGPDGPIIKREREEREALSEKKRKKAEEESETSKKKMKLEKEPEPDLHFHPVKIKGPIEPHMRVRTKPGQNLVSCSDKVLLWNCVGVQGALLSNFIPNIFINSITVSAMFDPGVLVNSLCCRLEDMSEHRVWIQHGGIEELKEYDPALYQFKNKRHWSIYWTHAGMDMIDEMEDLIRGAGIVDSNTGTHLHGTDREGEIPPHSKRNIFIQYKKLCCAFGAAFADERTYGDHKKRSVQYRINKNNYFKLANDRGMGRYPIMERSVDTFLL